MPSFLLIPVFLIYLLALFALHTLTKVLSPSPWPCAFPRPCFARGAKGVPHAPLSFRTHSNKRVRRKVVCVARACGREPGRVRYPESECARARTRTRLLHCFSWYLRQISLSFSLPLNPVGAVSPPRSVASPWQPPLPRAGRPVTKPDPRPRHPSTHPYRLSRFLTPTLRLSPSYSRVGYWIPDEKKRRFGG